MRVFTQIKGFGKVLNEQARVINNEIKSHDYTATDLNLLIDSFKLNLPASVLESTTQELLVACRNHNINVIVKAIKPFIKDTQILKRFASAQKNDLDVLKSNYLSTVNFVEIRDDFVARIAKKMLKNGKITNDDVARSLYGTLGIVVPFCNNLMYSQISTGSTSFANLNDEKKTLAKIESGNDLSRNQIVVSNTWIAARPIDEDCYSVHQQKRKVGVRFSNGFYSPLVHPNCLCTLVPHIVSRSAIKNIIKIYG